MAEVIKKATRDGYGNALVELAEKYESNIVGMNHTWMKPGYILEALVKNMQEMF